MKHPNNRKTGEFSFKKCIHDNKLFRKLYVICYSWKSIEFFVSFFTDSLFSLEHFIVGFSIWIVAPSSGELKLRWHLSLFAFVWLLENNFLVRSDSFSNTAVAVLPTKYGCATHKIWVSPTKYRVVSSATHKIWGGVISITFNIIIFIFQKKIT